MALLDRTTIFNSHVCVFESIQYTLEYVECDMVELSFQTFQRWKQGGNPVSYIRCDNAGENKSLQRRANSVDWRLNLVFEYTPTDTPQHNYLA
jgi:hypothetical protein